MNKKSPLAGLAEGLIADPKMYQLIFRPEEDPFDIAKKIEKRQRSLQEEYEQGLRQQKEEQTRWLTKVFGEAEKQEKRRIEAEEAERMLHEMLNGKTPILGYLEKAKSEELAELMRRGRSALIEVLGPAMRPGYEIHVELATDSDAFDVCAIDTNGLKASRTVRYSAGALRSVSDEDRARWIISIATGSGLRDVLQLHLLDPSVAIKGDRYFFTRPLCEPVLATNYPEWVTFINEQDLVFESVRVGEVEVRTVFAGIKNKEMDVFCTKVVEADDTRIVEYYPSWEKAMLGHFRHVGAIREQNGKQEQGKGSSPEEAGGGYWKVTDLTIEGVTLPVTGAGIYKYTAQEELPF